MMFLLTCDKKTN